MEQEFLIEKDGPVEGEQERSQNLFSDIPSLLQIPFIRSSLHPRGGTVQGPEYEEVGITGDKFRGCLPHCRCFQAFKNFFKYSKSKEK